MKSLLLVAHGSRREQSNAEIAALTESLASRLHNQFSSIQHAFLELAEPAIPEVIDQMVTDGAREIVILPYFLSAGRHVFEDIPNVVEAKQQQHTGVKILVAPYLGEAVDIIEVLARLSRQTDEK